MKFISLLSLTLIFISSAIGQPYIDKPYVQDYAEKFVLDEEVYINELFQVRSDRNKVINVLSKKALLHPFEGKLREDIRNRPLTDAHIQAIGEYQGQFIYLTDQALLSFAWAGRYYVEHNMPAVKCFAMGPEFSAMLAQNGQIAMISENTIAWETKVPGFVPLEVLFDEEAQQFLVLTQTSLYALDYNTLKFSTLYQGDFLTAMEVQGQNIILGTRDGIITWNRTTKKASALNQKLPHTHITSIRNIQGRLWYGSTYGAFAMREDGKYDYYASERWLPDNHVLDITKGPDESILILTKKGLSKIVFKKMTLADKAEHFQKIQRLRHIRYGFTANLQLERKGDLSSGVFRDTDNDGLWTSMYLAGELFRYAATKSDDAKHNAYEAFEAMERLTEISKIPGFPARTYEIDSYQSSDTDPFKPEDEKIWRLTEDKRWRWKSTTSSDESCGHFFVYALFAEIAPDKEMRDRAIHQLKIEMDHIIDNDWYLITWNGKPTQWGRWNPEYVNSFPIEVGDRRLNSSLILSFLQTTYHFTKDEKYKQKAYELIEKHGYLENTLRPASIIGHVKGQFLSDAWNHSDDEMYFLTAPGMVKYAFTEKMKEQYLATVKSHWEVERSEKNPLWNYLYFMVGGTDYDWEESAWWLREFPMDLISWDVNNSHRKDLTKVAPNFRNQEYTEVLPRDERPMHLHNNAYRNTYAEGGKREYDPYIYLLPYWLGRYTGAIISE